MRALRTGSASDSLIKGETRALRHTVCSIKVDDGGGLCRAEPVVRTPVPFVLARRESAGEFDGDRVVVAGTNLERQLLLGVAVLA